MQVREVEERVAQKVHDLTKELLSKEKDVKKMEELVSTLTEELAICKDKENHYLFGLSHKSSGNFLESL